MKGPSVERAGKMEGLKCFKCIYTVGELSLLSWRLAASSFANFQVVTALGVDERECGGLKRS